MNIVPDYNKDNKIDWKDFIFYGVSIIGNVVFTIVNIVK